jgi:hypothetical protein
LRPDRGGDRKGRSDRDAVQEMLHASNPLVAVRDWTMRCKGWINPRAARPGLGPETTDPLLRSREYVTQTARIRPRPSRIIWPAQKPLSSARVVFDAGD